MISGTSSDDTIWVDGNGSTITTNIGATINVPYNIGSVTPAVINPILNDPNYMEILKEEEKGDGTIPSLRKLLEKTLLPYGREEG